MDEASHYLAFAASFARGRLGLRRDTDDVCAVELAEQAGLRLTKFKRSMDLPRVHAVIGILRGLAPSDLLDIGSGRGTFLWPLLDAMPWLPVTCIDADPQRSQDLMAVQEGGVERLTAFAMDAHRLAFADQQFDVVTALEILEHLRDPATAAREAMRVARRFVVVSVPSKPDDNPEHIHLFDVPKLQSLLLGAGAARVTIEHVLNHRIAIARKP